MLYKITRDLKSLVVKDKYCLSYKEGEMTHSTPNTMGIF